MAITGTIPLSGAKGAIEGTRGTAGTATRLLPILGGSLTEHQDKLRPQEHRASYLRNWRAPIVQKVWAEVTGFEVAPTFQSLAYYLAHVAGGTASGTAGTSTYRYWNFTPNGTADNLLSNTLLVGDDTSWWQLPFALVQRLEFGWQVGGAATLSMDWIAQRATAAGAGTATVVNDTDDINGALAKAYLDSTTVGSTLVTTVQSYKFTLEQAWTAFFAPDGNLYPADFYRAETRAASVEATLAFTSTTEYAAFQANSARKFRTVIDGGTVPSTGGSPFRAQFDWFGHWDEASFGEQEGLRTIQVKGESEVSTADGTVDWNVKVYNDLTSIL